MNFKYIIIPSNIILNHKIPMLAKVLYGEIKVLSFKNGYCEVSNSFLAKNNNCSTRTIIRMLNILKDENCIEINGNKKRKIKIINDSDVIS
ncbi:MAG: helix-turn-helix domain-containing protein [Clostridia bacterium]|nr:helix-turn-helix domain-containing protein [Clostridia bacterium]